MYSYAFSVVVGLYYHVPNANLQKIFEIYVPIYSFLRQKTPKLPPFVNYGSIFGVLKLCVLCILLVSDCLYGVHAGGLAGRQIAEEYANESTYGKTEPYRPEGHATWHHQYGFGKEGASVAKSNAQEGTSQRYHDALY